MTESSVTERPAPQPSAFPAGEPPSRGIPFLTEGHAYLPAEVEQILIKLYNENIRAQRSRRALNEHLQETKVAFRKAQIIATMDPECPRPNRSDVTVAQREAWIDGVIFDEWHAHEMAKTNLENQDGYLHALEEASSLFQSMKGVVGWTYNNPAAARGGS